MPSEMNAVLLKQQAVLELRANCGPALARIRRGEGSQEDEALLEQLSDGEQALERLVQEASRKQSRAGERR